MAKRKRLTLPPTLTASGTPVDPPEMPAGPPGARRRLPPISDVAGAAATGAALDAVLDEMQQARAEGRMIVLLDHDRIDETYLVRDRMAMDAAELDALCASLRARGQQVAIEVVELGPDRYGLISGWRRLTALRQLHAETGEDRFARVRCLVRRPADAPEAYLAMVEENEIRAGLSFYEKARIAARAAEQGVFPDAKAALKGLFGSVSAPKRSKIGSFVTVYRHLDSALEFPAAIPERLGLAIAGAIEADPGFAGRLGAALAAAAPQDAAAERRVLERALRRAGRPERGAATREEVAPGLYLERGRGRLVLSGQGVDAALADALRAWLAQR